MVAGTLHQRALCQACAQKYTPNVYLGGLTPAQFPWLSGMVAQLPGAAPLPAGPDRCQGCGHPFAQFQQSSMLGCPHCYLSFAPQMLVILRRAQGGVVKHSGKVPARRGGTLAVERQVEKLRRMLDEAVKDERFEEAARLRDEIHSAQEKMKHEPDS